MSETSLDALYRLVWMTEAAGLCHAAVAHLLGEGRPSTLTREDEETLREARNHLLRAGQAIRRLREAEVRELVGSVRADAALPAAK